MTSFEGDLAHTALVQALRRDAQRIAIVGFTPAGLGVRACLCDRGLGHRVIGIFDPGLKDGSDIVAAWDSLFEMRPDLLVIADDARKESLLAAFVEGSPGGEPPETVIAGTAHLDFSDDLFAELDAPALVPSYATGYDHTRVHMFQYLRAAAANGLSGAIVEFGAFKGGTTAWLARVAQRLGLRSKVIAFDSWAGFPPRRTALDMYEHPRCVFSDMNAVRSYLEPLGVELVEGDITETAPIRLRDERILLAFVDTDNYSPAKSALESVLPNLVLGGAIVLDHFHTTSEFIYTLGERMAAKEVLGQTALLQIHGTGVFVRLS